MCLLAGAAGKFLRIECANVRSIRFGPTRGGVFLHGDGEFRVRFAVGRKKATRIADCGLTLPTGKNAGSNLARLEGHVASGTNGAGAIFGGESGGLHYESVDA